ncbi:winged helix-turn-helix transcriptional regulator [Marinilongibacter aquaticus]|uniref:winged helix-turn-helix transcriptional regulator n=1 Tax=Marinilongibacter aquaticus TaxID=2975157 RepID=UPI0021BD2738|nr:winged helix-turn-helix transcriptional regulator [Marinilongibacter aquaticus]UBM57376.1 winged helix-turn-helix transcriptional regulator [Marinilongibacter aquaticus]
MELNCENEVYEIDGKRFPCCTSITMGYIGGKWKMVILYHLKDGARRYNALKKAMPLVTERTLSLQLKALEEDGIISRKVYVEKPPMKVEYQLTDFGEGLIPLLNEIAKWGMKTAVKKAKVVSLT